MLCITRSPDEWAIITTPEGRIIRVCAKRGRGDQVKLGFQADRDIIIMREELLEREGER